MNSFIASGTWILTFEKLKLSVKDIICRNVKKYNKFAPLKIEINNAGVAQG